MILVRWDGGEWAARDVEVTSHIKPGRDQHLGPLVNTAPDQVIGLSIRFTPAPPLSVDSHLDLHWYTETDGSMVHNQIAHAVVKPDGWLEAQPDAGGHLMIRFLVGGSV
jgi:hypothetical protein